MTQHEALESFKSLYIGDQVAYDDSSFSYEDNIDLHTRLVAYLEQLQHEGYITDYQAASWSETFQ